MLLLASIAFPCTWYIYDDYSDGSADGRQYGGSFVAGGWRPDGGTIVYDLPDLVSGTITFRLSNVDEVGVSQHDFLELFSGADGSFSDSRRDNFLQVKFAGDIYDGYDGRVKLQAGPEWYGEVEVGSWTSEFNWDPAQSYDFTVAWGSRSAAISVGGGSSTSIDYSVYGDLTFNTLRVPNDGSYARDGLLDDVIIAGVSLCGEEGTPTSPDDTGQAPVDDGGDDDGGTDDGGTDDGGGGDTDEETPDDGDVPVAAAPEVSLFEVTPSSGTVGDDWVVDWLVEGDATDVDFCFAAEGARFESCSGLRAASGTATFGTTGLEAGDYWAWIDTRGPGGETRSSARPLVLAAVPASPAAGCASTPGGLLAAVVAVSSCVATRRRV